ncbi:MAG: cation-translocating P-type ATPase [Kineosporiaceae bacterium]|nr:cation-translocating P-type ATPase [Kineosporiaceae bacterium]
MPKSVITPLAGPPASPEHWHGWPVEELARHLSTDLASGLEPRAASAALERHGPNALPEIPARGLARMVLDQLADFMIIVLVAAAVVSGLVGEVADTVAIVVIVVLNAVLGVVQEYRAERAMVALRTLAAPSARVRRAGQALQVPAHEVVPGDLVLLEAGGVVPADVRLVDAARLATQESALTGESVAVEKGSHTLDRVDLAVADRTNMAFKGTTVAAGRGVGLVVATGLQTELGGIAQLLGATATQRTPLQRRLSRLGTWLALLVLAVCVVVFVAGLLRGEDPALMFLTAVSLAVAAIPEALPAMVAITLALGAYRLVGQQALIRRLPAVETLGSITTICSDKTGTLTENRMRVEAIEAPDDVARRALVEVAVLCNDAELIGGEGLAGEGTSGDGTIAVVGEPTEVALLEGALAAGTDVVAVRRAHPRHGEVPFDSDRKLMSTVHPDGEGDVSGDVGVRVCVKGAPEAVLARCGRLHEAGGEVPMTPDARQRVEARVRDLAAGGMRVLAMAEKRCAPSTPDDPGEADQLESELSLLGLVALFDPPRPEALAAVAECRSAGITPVMITGDHPATAVAVATRLGICAAGDREVLTGVDLARLDEEALAERVRRVRVYARVDPAQKIRIVQALQSGGELVAMTGDGVNDAPALKRADIGVAMGRGGTDVAREAASMVLLDDNFATITRAVREGRRIYDNIRKFVKYAMTGNSAEIWLIFLAPFLGLPLPLLPIHILWVNLVTDGLPGIMLARQPAEPGVMQRPPRPPSESVFARGMWQHMLWVGLLMGGVCLAVQAAAIESGAHWQSMVFTVLTLSQLGHVLAIRSESASVLSRAWWTNRWLLLTVLATTVVQLAILYLPWLNDVFSTQPLSGGELLVCLAASSVVFLAVEAEKAIRRRAARRRGHVPVG